jgi:head-tail adaptor
MIKNMIQKFGQPLTVQRKTRYKDGAYWKETWTDHLNVIGVFDDSGGQEIVSGDGVQVQSRFRLFCYPADIKENDRLSVGGKLFDVKYVGNPMLANRFLQIDLEYNQNEQV